MKTKQDIFQALADPTRRAILMLIAAKTMTPGAIAEHFDSSRQAVSKHIKILAESDVLKQEKSGREIYYYLNPDKMDELDIWLKKIKQLWETRFDQLDNVLYNLKTNKNEQ